MTVEPAQEGKASSPPATKPAPVVARPQAAPAAPVKPVTLPPADAPPSGAAPAPVLPEAKPARPTRPVPAAVRAKAKTAASRAKPVRKAPAAIEEAPVKVRPMAGPARRKLRHKGVLASFAVIVLLPLALAFWYLEAKAVDQYASTLGFTVRSEELKSATDILGGVGSVLGGGGSKDSDILYEFIRSQEMVAAIDARLDLRALYSRHYSSDPLFGFPPDGSIEDLTSFWSRVVRISYDSSSGLMELRVLAFTAEEARTIARAILEESTRMINSLSVIAREDSMRYASEDLAIALERLKEAREEITAFRLENRIVDVNADIQGQMGLLNTLQAQLAEALIEYDLLRQTAREGDPRLDQAQNRISVIQGRIVQEREKFGGEGTNYATTVAEFERLTVEREFAETTYLAALQAYDGARAEASRKSRYLATYIQPTLAQTAEFPQRLLIIGLVGLFAFLVWSIASLIFYALRDRR